MQQKLIRLFALGLFAAILTSCGQNQADDIAQSIENVEFNDRNNGGIHPSNVKQQNKLTVQNESETATYADEIGYYLDQFYVQLKESRDFFYKQPPTKQEAEKVKEHLQKIETMTNDVFELTLPPEFVGFHHVHMAALIEFDSLKTTIEKMDKPTRKEMTQARVYYENTVISLKQMEREYKDVLFELGLK